MIREIEFGVDGDFSMLNVIHLMTFKGKIWVASLLNECRINVEALFQIPMKIAIGESD